MAEESTEETEGPQVVGEIHLSILEDDVILNTDFDPAQVIFWLEMFKSMFMKGLMEEVTENE